MQGMRFRLAALVVCLFLIPAAFADKVDDYLLKFMEDKKVPGLQIGIFKDGKVVKAKGYGSTAVENGKSVTEETLFNIGSVTKQFTSAAVMILHEERKLSIEDSVRKSIPELPEKFEPITIRMVLGHISGLGDYSSVAGFDFHGQPTEEEFIKLLSESELAGKPAEKYLYSNIGYALLGIVVRRAAGVPYEEFVASRIFKKIGMTSTVFIQPGAWPTESATGFNVREGKPVPGRTERAKIAAPSGAILTNALDMAKWDAALRDDSLLTKSSRDLMWTAQTITDGKSTGYGFGWNVLKNDRGFFVMHTGATVAGFRGAIIRQVDGPYSAVVFANLGSELGLTNVLNEAVKLWKEENDKSKLSFLQPIPNLDQRHLHASLPNVFTSTAKTMLFDGRAIRA